MDLANPAPSYDETSLGNNLPRGEGCQMRADRVTQATARKYRNVTALNHWG